MNNWFKKKMDQRIKTLKKSPYESLSISEKLEIIQNKLSKYPREEKVTYEEFELACLANWELGFDLRGVSYEIIHMSENNVSFLIDTKKINGECTWRQEEIYATSEELLARVRIDGQTIKQIWDEVIC